MLNGTGASPLHVAFIGGIERNDRQLAQMADEMNVVVEFHDGDVGGRRSEGLAAVVRRADHVVVFSAINSHGGVNHAKRYAKEFGRGLTIVRSYGLASARRVLAEISATHGGHHSIRRLAS